MKKPTELGNLNASDYRAIAENAGISYQTVVKWFGNSLTVRPSTERKIIDAWVEVCKGDCLSHDEMISKNRTVIAKLEAMNLELKSNKQIIMERLSIIAEL